MSGDALFFGSGMAIGAVAGIEHVWRHKQHDWRRATLTVLLTTLAGMAVPLAYLCALVGIMQLIDRLWRWATTVPARPKTYSVDEFRVALRELPSADKANVVPSLRTRRQ